ncbi:MAG: hypothetical protein Q9187_001266 [Circinaria calcarea]
MTDLEVAIEIAREAVHATPEDHPDRAGLLNSLGNRLRDRYLRTGAMADLEEAIQTAREAVHATPKDHPSRAGRLNNLGIRIRDRYLRTGAMADLEEAIPIAREAVHATPEDHPDRAGQLHNLGAQLGDRYSRTGAMADLEEAIQITREAVHATPEDHPDRAGRLNNLGARLRDRYSRTGAMADLEEAIEIARKAVHATPKDHPDRARHLNNLGVIFGDRYLRTGAMADLEEAIEIARKAVHATPEDHPGRAGYLYNLGNRFGDRYLRTGAMADLEEAIEIAREAVYATPEDHFDRAKLLNSLGARLGDKYSRTGAMADLEEAIEIAQEAVHTTPEDHPDRAGLLNNLGNRLGDRYLKTGAVADLEKAIQIAREAVHATPEDYPDRARHLNNLAARLGDRYSRTGAMADLEKVVLYYQSALHQSNSPTIARILAGKEVLRFCVFTSDWQQAYKDSTIAVNLIPKLALRSLENSDKQHLLSMVVGLACNLTAVALQVQEAPSVAVKLLEQGRGVLATSLEEIRTDILDLQGRHPELADQFVSLRDELEPPVTRNNTLFTDDNRKSSLQARASRRYDAGKELDKLIFDIRKRPGFKDFLLPPSEKEMQAAARCGPIVVINVSEYRCDALLVEQHQIRSLALPHLNSKDIEKKTQRGRLGSREILEWLWDAIANPILDALGFTQPPSGESWPHVWWIPTGPLSKFPLHAAGRHGEGSTQTVLDRVMSSYSSSIKAIIHGRRSRIPEPTQSVQPQALLVAMRDTPGHRTLPSATDEVAIVHHLYKSMALDPVEPGRHKQDIVSQLPNCKIFHFAGHGRTHESDPSQSDLLLEDWESDRLTVANLLEMNLRERSPFLAYLSACGTGRINDERFVDESIHLISACQLAGFRHVIGTLWEVDDDLCKDMAKITYEEIKEGIKDGRMTDESVCRGLHKATRELRDRWLSAPAKTKRGRRSVREAITFWAQNETETRGACDRDERYGKLPRDADLDSEDEETGPTHWVPYVHFGV